MAPSATYRAASVLSGVYYGGSAIVSTVNSITPHLAGAVDILVVEQPDGSRRSTPFYVRFGKYAAIRSREREVKIYVNGEEAPFSMVLGSFGQAYFASETVQLGSNPDQHDGIAEAMSPVSGYSSGDEPVNALGVPEQLAEAVDGGSSTVVDLGTIQSGNATTHVQLQHPDNNAATISEVTVYREPGDKSKTPQDGRYRRQVSWPALGNENITSPISPPRSNSTLVSEQPPPDADSDWMSSSEAAARAVAAVDAQVTADTREQDEVTSQDRSSAVAAAEPGIDPPSSFAGTVPDFMKDRGESASHDEALLDAESPEEVRSLKRVETRYLSVSSLPSFNSNSAITNDEETLDSVEEGGNNMSEVTSAVWADPPATCSGALPTPEASVSDRLADPTNAPSFAPVPPVAVAAAELAEVSELAELAHHDLSPIPELLSSTSGNLPNDALNRPVSQDPGPGSSSIEGVPPSDSSASQPSTSANEGVAVCPAGTNASDAAEVSGQRQVLVQGRGDNDTPGSSRGQGSRSEADGQTPAVNVPITTSSSSATNHVTQDIAGPSSRRADAHVADVGNQSEGSSFTPDTSNLRAKPPTTPLRDQEPAPQSSWPKPSPLSPNINIPTSSKYTTAFQSREHNDEDSTFNRDHNSHRRDVSLSPPHGGSFDSAMSPYSSFEAGYMGDVERRVREGGGSLRQGLATVPGAVALGIQGFELSLCGHMLSKDMGAGEAQQVFEAHKVTAEQFTQAAMQLTQSQELVVRMGTTLYPWSAAAPIVLGMLAFGGRWDHLTKEACWKLQDGELHAGSKLTPPRKQAGWRLWPFGSWGSSSSQAAAGAAAADSSGPATNRSYSAPANASRDLHLDSLPSEDPAGGSSDEGGLVSPPAAAPTNRMAGKQHVVVKKKTVGPTSEQLASLPLQEGQNHITYRIGKATELHAYVYLMKWTARLVISDIDGTITKSDILGHVLPAIGYDWSHPGITQLFTNITQNGYQMMYLSSRSIAQASITRDYLHSLDQEGKKMPQGPVIISPQGILPSLYREMILRRPHEFKIACLRDIRSLFPEECNPFYAGFGNRDTDLLSYKEVGVPTSRIFIINPKGELRRASSTVQSSTWSSLKAINALVHEVFPPNQTAPSRSQSVDESFSDLNYWKAPIWIPDVDEEEDEPLKTKPKPAAKSNSSRFKRSPSEISSDFISSINPL